MLLTSAPASSGSPLWLSIIEGISAVILILGIGGFAAIFKSIRRNAVRDDKLDELIHPDTGALKQIEAVRSDVQGVRNDVQEMMRFISPNGLRGDELGNIVKRTENSVKDLRADLKEDSKKLERHIGSCETEHAQIRRELEQKAPR